MSESESSPDLTAWDSDADHSHGISSSSPDTFVSHLELEEDEDEIYVEANRTKRDIYQEDRLFDETGDKVHVLRSHDNSFFSPPSTFSLVPTSVTYSTMLTQDRGCELSLISGFHTIGSHLSAPAPGDPKEMASTESKFLSDMDEESDLEVITDSLRVTQYPSAGHCSEDHQSWFTSTSELDICTYTDQEDSRDELVLAEDELLDFEDD